MKGINFKEPLFHATIERRKTETRRICENQNLSFSDLVEINSNRNYIRGYRMPRYKVGEVLYLKEPYRLEEQSAGSYDVHYQFGGSKQVYTVDEWINYREIKSIIKQQNRSKSGFANKLFMPEWAARYFIRITAARAERLQEISDEDCFREGIKLMEVSVPAADFRRTEFVVGDIMRSTPREAYAALIDKINGRGTWDSNPFVWVYGYELYKN